MCKIHKEIYHILSKKFTFLVSPITILIILFLCPNASSQPLWGGTLYGMSMDEVLFTIPFAKVVTNGDTLLSGEKKLIEKKRVEIVGNYFDAEFFFQNESLKVVRLTLRKDHLSSIQSVQSIYKSLKVVLTAKYGAMISDNSEDEEDLKIATATWVKDKTEISITLITLGNKPMTLFISYSCLAKDMDKL